MASSIGSFGRIAWASLRFMIIATIGLGLLYPLAVTAVAQVAFPSQANGSFIQVGGEDVGSALLGQKFEGDQWFTPRPSAAGEGYDAGASGGSNLGPNNNDLRELVVQRRLEVAAVNGVRPQDVPADAVTASGSGLDNSISPAYAAIQVERVAQARKLPVTTVRSLLDQATKGRILGFLGEPTVDVVALNAALATYADDPA